MSVGNENRGRVLVIGLGNPDRRDDGAGLVVADHLRRRGLAGATVVDGPRDLTGLLDLWADAESVILVDAVESSSPPGTVHRIDATALPFPSTRFRSSHAVDLRAVIELGRLLNRLPRRLIVYGIDSGNCAHGKGLSPEVDRAADEVVERIVSSI